VVIAKGINASNKIFLERRGHIVVDILNHSPDVTSPYPGGLVPSDGVRVVKIEQPDLVIVENQIGDADVAVNQTEGSKPYQ
jgi:hypothetical protein